MALASFLMPMITFNPLQTGAATNIVISGVRILSETTVAKGEEIKANSRNEFGSGVIIGRPVKAALKGAFWKTYELNINQGGFQDSNVYLGAIVHLSTDQKDVFDKFQTLDPEKSYIFEYKHKVWFNPEIEDSRVQVVAISTPEEYLKAHGITTIPAEIKSGDTHQGLYSNGVRRGRIVDVERYGLLGNFCYFELNVGGLESNGGDKGSSEALLEITVLDEEVCKYVEKVIALGQDVEIAYTQDIIEQWQPSDYYCKGIKCIPHVTTTTSPDGQSTVKRLEVPLSDSELQRLKKSIVEDPQFLDSLIQALKQKSEGK